MRGLGIGMGLVRQTGGPSDPHWNSVVLSLPLDGVDGATATADVSQSNHSITFVDDAQLDTAQKKSGSASLLLDGTGDRLSAPASTDWNIATAAGNPWTVECHYRANSFAEGSNDAILAYYNNAANRRAWAIFAGGAAATGFFFAWQQYSAGTATPILQLDNDTAIGGVGGGAETDVWYHLAACSDGTTVRLFVEGVGDETGTAAAIHSAGRVLDIGSLFLTGSYDRFVDGHIDNIRITKGVARYTANFTPPTGPYPTQ